MDATRIEIFLQEGIQFLLFGGREWIDLAALWSCVWKEFDCVVSRLGSQKLVKGILEEDGVEVAEVWRKVSLMICQLGVLS